MKKYITAAALLVFMVACGDNKTSDKEANANEAANQSEATADISSNPDYQKGLELIGKNDCLTCHKVTEKLIGPSYEDVANKYAGSDTAVQYLAHKIITGGQGVWGQVPMTPHPQLSNEDAESMAKYILLLKK